MGILVTMPNKPDSNRRKARAADPKVQAAQQAQVLAIKQPPFKGPPAKPAVATALLAAAPTPLTKAPAVKTVSGPPAKLAATAQQPPFKSPPGIMKALAATDLEPSKLRKHVFGTRQKDGQQIVNKFFRDLPKQVAKELFLNCQ